MSEETTAVQTSAPAEAPAAESAPKDWRAKVAEFKARASEGTESESTQEAPADGAAEGEEKPKTEGEKNPEEDRYTKAFSALTRERSKLRQAQETFQREQAEWRSERETLAHLRETLPKDPVGALRTLSDKIGIPFHKLYSTMTQAILQDGEPPPPEEVARKTAQEQIDAFKREQQEAQQKAELERQREIVQREYVTSLGEISEVLKTGDFPFCAEPMEGQTPEQRAEQVAKAALAEMAQHYAKTKQVMEYGEALAKIETELERYHRGLSAAAEAKARRQSAQAREDTVSADDDGYVPHPASPGKPKTISSRLTSETSAPRELSWKERRERFLKSG